MEKSRVTKNAYLVDGHRIASDRINELDDNEIFVFGSNVQGYHGGGAAWFAHKHLGAQWGVGEGLTGRTYALPTMEGMAPLAVAVSKFIDCARQHPEYTFLVTAVGCGIAGYSPNEIAPLFREATELTNVYLPQVFIDILFQ
ncbi:MAG: hypothetical protein J6X58_07020 [Bacteroidales bacterium]|nr:hypothetical protein [Bacteroidales bacterium]